ncbi:hypothetical protein IE4803_CH04261 [Rhizobium etli bv. phaseoli str. IE4803]|nr:hypothetical protein IE4803_CH04261 [Rhizobium etli bv. phaseoli str. IE4803]
MKNEPEKSGSGRREVKETMCIAIPPVELKSKRLPESGRAGISRMVTMLQKARA